jgi:hypothetical protein
MQGSEGCKQLNNAAKFSLEGTFKTFKRFWIAFFEKWSLWTRAAAEFWNAQTDWLFRFHCNICFFLQDFYRGA